MEEQAPYLVKRTEHAEQAAFIEWCERQKNTYPALAWLFAIPNGGKRHVTVARQMKAEGVRAGVPDLFLPTRRGPYAGLFLETKVKPNRTTREQRTWLEHLEGEGYAAAVCYGCDELIETVLWYLGLEAK